MIAALTVYSKDAPAALDLLAWINELGGVSHRTLVLGTTPQVNPAPLVAEARKGWGLVEQFTISGIAGGDVQPWPTGNNINFYSLCQYMQRHPQPFLFLESDVFPLRTTWMDELEAEYVSAAKPFMGEVHAVLDHSGKPIPGSEHMNGAGIYPPKVLSYLPTAPYITSAVADQAWDMYLRWEMLYLVDRNGGFQLDRTTNARIKTCHATQKICFQWRSFQFHIDPQTGLWLCRTEPHAAHRQLDFDQHVLHHGCKDGTLVALLRARARGSRIDAQAVVVAPPMPIAPPIPLPAVSTPEPPVVVEEFQTPQGAKAFEDAAKAARGRGATDDLIAHLRTTMLAQERDVLAQMFASLPQAAVAFQPKPPDTEPIPLPDHPPVNGTGDLDAAQVQQTLNPRLPKAAFTPRAVPNLKRGRGRPPGSKDKTARRAPTPRASAATPPAQPAA